jgi:hypothetical protein
MTAAQVSNPVPVALDRRAVYLSPSGRRCRWVATDDAHQGRAYATFLYDLPDGAPGLSQGGDGFTLAAQNWHMLRRVR